MPTDPSRLGVHRPSGRWRLGLVLSLLCVFLWGLLPVALKILLRAMDPYTITWYRFVAAASLLGSYLVFRGRIPRLRGIRKRISVLLVLATLGLGGNYVLYVYGLLFVSAGAAQVLIQLAPATAVLGFLFFFREPFSRVQWLGLLVLGSGMLLFFHNRLDEIFLHFGGDARGAVLIVLSALAWAVYALAQKQLLEHMTSPAILLVIYCGATFLLLPAAAPREVFDLDASSFGLLIFCALNTLIAYGSFSEALAHWEGSKVSAVLSLTPLATLVMVHVASLLWPGVVASEPVTPLGLLGAGLVVLGSVIVALKREADVETS